MVIQFRFIMGVDVGLGMLQLAAVFAFGLVGQWIGLIRRRSGYGCSMAVQQRVFLSLAMMR